MERKRWLLVSLSTDQASQTHCSQMYNTHFSRSTQPSYFICSATRWFECGAYPPRTVIGPKNLFVNGFNKLTLTVLHTLSATPLKSTEQAHRHSNNGEAVLLIFPSEVKRHNRVTPSPDVEATTVCCCACPLGGCCQP